IESTKATAPVISPVSGTIIEVNSTLEDEPEIINTDPYGKGWIAVVEVAAVSAKSELLEAASYNAFIEEESG
ncbi:MAG TPA: glycine cleavage system protein H, partial [Nitrospirae bacterium]|nr:glycine cleavage system protein H [Nitrospirota bacterium]